jgi:hypothetical protein
MAVIISGFTFMRNENDLGYPLVPACRSLAQLCDESIVNVPRSAEGTRDTLRSIGLTLGAPEH